jgi:hypothetical protein
MGTRGSFPVGKAVGAWSCQSPPSRAEVKSTWSYTSTPPYASTAWCLVKHNFTLASLCEISHTTSTYMEVIWTAVLPLEIQSAWTTCKLYMKSFVCKMLSRMIKYRNCFPLMTNPVNVFHAFVSCRGAAWWSFMNLAFAKQRNMCDHRSLLHYINLLL